MAVLAEDGLRADCERAFREADEREKGYLTAEDYKVAVLSLLGYKPSKYEVATVWRDHVRSSKEIREDEKQEEEEGLGVRLEVFLSLMLRRLQKQDAEEVARRVFLAFDARCQGYLTEEDCARIFKQTAPHLSGETVRGMFREVDVNGDGRVSYRDFEIMMNYFSPKQKLDAS